MISHAVTFVTQKTVAKNELAASDVRDTQPYVAASAARSAKQSGTKSAVGSAAFAGANDNPGPQRQIPNIALKSKSVA